MKIVKLTFNYEWPLFRQTPSFSQVWGNYKFVIDDNLKECDYWIIYCDYKLKRETITCPKEHVIFIPGECYNTSPYFYKSFLKQFGAIITVQREIKHKNVIYSHNANPWFINKSYDELIDNSATKKNKLISVITSNKNFTEGHRKRLNFVEILKAHFGDQLDVFGRGIMDFDDKWEVLSQYKYSIAIENDFCEDWVTEKYFDCILAETVPIYYGCPNIKCYSKNDISVKIDINEPKEAIKIIEGAISNNLYESYKKALKEEKVYVLNNEQFFPWIVNILKKMDYSLYKENRLKLNKPSRYSFNILKKKLKYHLKL